MKLPTPNKPNIRKNTKMKKSIEFTADQTAVINEVKSSLAEGGTSLAAAIAKAAQSYEALVDSCVKKMKKVGLEDSFIYKTIKEATGNAMSQSAISKALNLAGIKLRRRKSGKAIAKAVASGASKAAHHAIAATPRKKSEEKEPSFEALMNLWAKCSQETKERAYEAMGERLALADTAEA